MTEEEDGSGNRDTRVTRRRRRSLGGGQAARVLRKKKDFLFGCLSEGCCCLVGWIRLFVCCVCYCPVSVEERKGVAFRDRGKGIEVRK